ncbi:zinc finger CCHC domain-containing protein 14-like isoform X2 [Orbicella faveolata]|uniref:zinc finger CCHC domain-containing protein 14-like isoform X2 n=1 Tax=Orbicella faveolata TaxID=48498 RepID=UPI0009E5B62C|nr:zinc finger CCHC domain-containing protein 14-like isoform X2 [Orbicella faveolata]
MKSVDVTNAKKQSQNNVSDEEETVTALDENGNEVKVLLPENSKVKEESKESLLNEKQGKNGFIKILPSKTLLPSLSSASSSSSSTSSSSGALLTTSQSSLTYKPLFPTAMPSNMLHMLTSNGLHSSLPSSLTSLQLTMPSSPVTSYPSPSPSSNGSPVTSPVSSPSFSRQRSCSGNINWTFRPHSHTMTVSEWLRNLRLHKYSEVFKGKTFDEMLKLSDKDFEKLGLTAGARKKIQVNLEVLRTSGCFTSNGLTIVDILPSPPSDLTPLQTSTHSKGILIPSSFPVHPPALSYNSDSEFLRSVSESDSASDCGSDVVSEPGTQVAPIFIQENLQF